MAQKAFTCLGVVNGSTRSAKVKGSLTSKLPQSATPPNPDGSVASLEEDSGRNRLFLRLPGLTSVPVGSGRGGWRLHQQLPI